MFDDDYYNVVRLGIIIVTIALIVATVLGFNAVRNTFNSNLEEFEQAVEELEQTNTSTEVAVEVNDNTLVENVQVEADKVINTTTYIDKSQNIINEAPHTSYVLPITLAIVFVFIIIVIERLSKYKKEKDERTERILNTPLKTYRDVETEELKDKYNQSS